MALRIVQQYDRQGEDWQFTIEDVEPNRPGLHPIIDHVEGLFTCDSVPALKKRLREALAACDQPVFKWIPAKLVEQR